MKTVVDESISEELVQETFIKLWEKVNTISENERSYEVYLITTLKNKIIDHHRKNLSRAKHTNEYLQSRSIEQEIENGWELMQQIDAVYATLHTKTVEIFKLSRDKGLTYSEIALAMQVSLKTVEQHISKALQAFRHGLKEFL